MSYLKYSTVLQVKSTQEDLLSDLATGGLDKVEQFALLDETDGVVTAADELACNEDTRDSASPSELLQVVLDFSHVGASLNGVILELDFLASEHLLNLDAVRTVRLGEKRHGTLGNGLLNESLSCHQKKKTREYVVQFRECGCCMCGSIAKTASFQFNRLSDIYIRPHQLYSHKLNFFTRRWVHSSGRHVDNASFLSG